MNGGLRLEGVRSADDLVGRLRELRAQAGSPSFRDIRRTVVRNRAERGVREHPALGTIHGYFRPGHRRLDVELVVDLALALGVDPAGAAAWRQACRAIATLRTEASIVPVSDRLPPASPEFVGRTDELTAVIAAAANGVTVTGMPGVGKTQLAVQAAHRIGAQSCLTVDLRGYDPGLPPAVPAAVLDGFLRVLGVPGERIQRQDLDARAATFRRLTADRSILVLLDNARDDAQVAPLIPDGSVIITSRRTPAAGAVVRLDVFTEAEALDYLGRTIGADRVVAEPEVAAELVELCGRLPMDLALAGAWIARKADWSLADHAARLRGFDRDEGVRPALAASYQALVAEQQTAFRRVGLHPGDDFTAADLAALGAIPLDQARVALTGLHREHLLMSTVDGRYRFHDLTRAYARRQAHDEDAETQRRASLGRLADQYLSTLHAAVTQLYPFDAGDLPAPPGQAADLGDAKAWLDAELGNVLLLAEYGSAEQVLALSAIAAPHLHMQGRSAQAVAVHSRAAELAGDHEQGIAARNAFARALAQQNRLDDAVEVFRQVIEHGDEVSVATAHYGIGEIHRTRSDFALAADEYRAALELARAAGHRPVELTSLIGLADTDLMRGNHSDAVDGFKAALDHARAVGHLRAVINATYGLGLLDQVRGDHASACTRYEDVVARSAEAGYVIGELNGLRGMGITRLLLGRVEAAEETYTRAMAMARAIDNHVAQGSLHHHIGGLRRRQGRPHEAIDSYRQARELARSAGDRNGEFEATYGTGRALHDLGRFGEALDAYEEAVAMAVELDQPHDEVRALDGMAHAHKALEDAEAARRRWQEALDVLDRIGATAAEEVTADSIRVAMS